MQQYRKLAVWAKAHRLAVDVRRSLRGVAAYDLADQLRRATTSVPANIVEGAGSQSPAQFGRYLGIALASCQEAEYLLLLGTDTCEFDPRLNEQLASRFDEIQKMLASLLRTVRKAEGRPRKVAPPKN